MIIQYDTRPDATVDQKLMSLIRSIQLALDEVGIREDNTITSQNEDVSSLISLVRQLREDVTSLADAVTGIDGRVTILEGQQPLPDPPTEDGAYKLTVTVTDGEPVYTWELVEGE